MNDINTGSKNSEEGVAGEICHKSFRIRLVVFKMRITLLAGLRQEI